MCDVTTYRRRLWCRAEQLCYVLRQGRERMWLATGASAEAVGVLSEVAGWLEDNLHVFEGDATDESEGGP